MQARFSLKGELIPADADLPTHLGLHHHGEEAEVGGCNIIEKVHRFLLSVFDLVDSFCVKLFSDKNTPLISAFFLRNKLLKTSCVCMR